jgi:hypothetical protein
VGRVGEANVDDATHLSLKNFFWLFLKSQLFRWVQWASLPQWAQNTSSAAKSDPVMPRAWKEAIFFLFFFFLLKAQLRLTSLHE